MHIEIYTDLVCPWCRIGKKQLMDGLALWEGETVTLQYRAFLLDPDVPAEGDSFRARLVERKGISDEQLHRMTEQVTACGRSVGLQFDFEQVTVIPNTLLAHQLIALAPASYQEVLLDSLMEAFFERNVNIGLPAELAAIGAAAGLPEAESLVEQAVAGGGLISVKRDLREAKAVGLTGVPYFVVNGKYSISGARSAQGIVRALAWAAQQESGGKP